MSEPFLINDIKQNPGCYLDSEPAIVRELPDINRFVFFCNDKKGLVWGLTNSRIFYYRKEKDIMCFAKISEEGQKKILKLEGFNPEEYEIDFEEEEDYED